MKISVVVITKNEEKNIADCLRSLVSQEYSDEFEIMVVDSSTDRTPEIVKKFTAARLVPETKKGFSAARNSGIRESKYDYVAFIDADCIAPKNWLAKLSEGMGDFSGVGGNAYPPEGSPFFGRCIACLGYPAGGALGIEPADNIVTCNALFRKQAIASVGGFDERLTFGGEDSDISRRLKSANHKLKILGNSYVWHKTRTLSEFTLWSFRRGRARYWLSKNILHFFYPLSVFAYLLSKKYRKLLKIRHTVKLNILSIMLVVPTLFFFKQVLASLGWLYGFLESTGK